MTVTAALRNGMSPFVSTFARAPPIATAAGARSTPLTAERRDICVLRRACDAGTNNRRTLKLSIDICEKGSVESTYVAPLHNPRAA